MHARKLLGFEVLLERQSSTAISVKVYQSTPIVLSSETSRFVVIRPALQLPSQGWLAWVVVEGLPAFGRVFLS